MEAPRFILTKKIIDSLNQLVTAVYKHLQDVNAKSLTYDKDSDSAYIRLIFSLNRQIRHFIEQFSEEGTVRESYKLPLTIDFVTKINNRFLKRDATNVMRSIGNMYEFAYKRDDIERNEIPD